MRRLKGESNLQWFLGGDYNEILNVGKEVGGGSLAPRQTSGFNLALSECGLADVRFEGYPFTWSNGRVHPNTVRYRLDRVCADLEALSLFPMAKVSDLDQPSSDHLSLLL